MKTALGLSMMADGAFPIDKWSVEDLVPHAAPMVLLDKLTSASVGLLRATAAINKSSPFYMGTDGVAAWWAIEYMAQAVAAYAGLRDRAAGREVPIGFLTSCRRFTCNQPVIRLGTNAEIRVDEIMAMEESLAVFECSMQADEFSASAILSVYSGGGVKDGSQPEQ